MVVTDQMGITQPSAIRAALDNNVLVNLYSHQRTYHPKVFLAYNSGEPTAAVIGSANLSYSGLVKGEEAALLIRERVVLDSLGEWFEDLFEIHSKPLHAGSAEFSAFETSWKNNALRRIRDHAPVLTNRQPASLAVDVDSLEDLFAKIQLPLATLGFDQAGNNIRNLQWLYHALENENPKFKTKGTNELKLLGLLDPSLRELTPLGRSAKNLQIAAFAREWVRWLFNSSEVSLSHINPRLVKISCST
jgi:hypothetical protein